MNEQKITEEIRDTFAKGLKRKMDIFHLSEVLYRKNPGAWKKLTKEGVLPLQKDSLAKVEVEVRIENAQKLKLKLPSSNQ
ncbi:hypothetical protein GK047_07435 [Paenibacillus sp. SYP-B3998]|uniref:Spore germination GerAC-like C-terminal domain-containing protein n=1 Tax=Paenibacillus sp. SYP-B3998 TaxID=2678564 RepID=A0A6G3ZUX9_9BACL|nr:Ger(x)C family spore germination C-terminal domain-containing protein [Paenibacillus sp. SYP-B3998]NEW05848.1 hypothetical protein [Paenibacillus sp. SYP-B3998]